MLLANKEAAAGHTKEFQHQQRQERAAGVADRMQQAVQKRQALEERMNKSREERDIAIRTRMGPGMEVCLPFSVFWCDNFSADRCSFELVGRDLAGCELASKLTSFVAWLCVLVCPKEIRQKREQERLVHVQAQKKWMMLLQFIPHLQRLKAEMKVCSILRDTDFSIAFCRP
jgi:hypothetical protein